MVYVLGVADIPYFELFPGLMLACCQRRSLFQYYVWKSKQPYLLVSCIIPVPACGGCRWTMLKSNPFYGRLCVRLELELANEAILILLCQGRRRLGTPDRDYVTRSRAPGSPRGFTPPQVACLE